MELYEKLVDRRDHSLDQFSWVGNLRWMGKEDLKPHLYHFQTIPGDAADADIDKTGEYFTGEVIGRRTMFDLEVAGIGEGKQYSYRPDVLEIAADGGRYSLHFPFEQYGAILKMESANGYLMVKDSRLSGRIGKNSGGVDLQTTGRKVVLHDGRYWIVFHHNGSLDNTKQDTESFRIYPPEGAELLVSVAFHVEQVRAETEAELLFAGADQQIEKSRVSWESYLLSCPVCRYAENYVYFNNSINSDVVLTGEEIFIRQLWHWVAARVNLYQLEFNRYSTVMVPDKAIWFGTWSNDGPASLTALSCTNAAPLVRECLIHYICASINDAGTHSWYTHSFGEGCYGREGDSGFYSHGVPNFLHAVDFYIRQTGDHSILDGRIQEGVTLWDRLKQYIVAVFEQRDCNGDGLIEWCNLWETGWDDKSGPFFSNTERTDTVGPRSTVTQWLDVILEGTKDDYEKFYRENGNPVTTMVEQCYFLWALKSMINLCELKGDAGVKQFCEDRYTNMVKVIRSRHWSDESGFYHDWDVNRTCLHPAKSLDALYFIGFESSEARRSSLMKHLNSTEEFNLRFQPTLSRDSGDFNPDGYWCGGYWPREAMYVGLALNQAGFKAKAEETVLKALCSETGKVVAENMNPLTGVNTTQVTSMAYSSVLPLVLREIKGEASVPYYEY